MARVSSDYDVAGTYGNLVIYKVGTRLYARSKSSLDGKRFWKDKAFARSREKAAQFGAASKLAKAIYATLPKAVKRLGLFGKLTGIIHKGLQEGKTKSDIEKEVWQYCSIEPPVLSNLERDPVEQRQPVINSMITQLSDWQVDVTGRLRKAPYSPKRVLRSG